MIDVTCRGAGTILYVGPSNQNKCYGPSGGTNTYEVPLDCKVGGTYPPVSPCCSAPSHVMEYPCQYISHVNLKYWSASPILLVVLTQLLE